VIYQTLDEPIGNDELKGRFDIPQTLEEFMVKMKEGGYDAKTFAVKLREMVHHSPLHINAISTFVTVRLKLDSPDF